MNIQIYIKQESKQKKPPKIIGTMMNNDEGAVQWSLQAYLFVEDFMLLHNSFRVRNELCTVVMVNSGSVFNNEK